MARTTDEGESGAPSGDSQRGKSPGVRSAVLPDAPGMDTLSHHELRRRVRRAFLALSVGAVIGVPAGAAQQTTGSTAVASGVVYDSIARRTIPGATVEFVNANDPSMRPYTTVSDAAGRYRLSGLPFGSYLAGFFHAALDTLGLESRPRRVDVSVSQQRLNLATPSVQTIVASICPAGSASDSTGLLIGHVRSTDEQGPIPGASVRVEWNETVIDAQGVRDRTRSVTGRAAEPGWFAICGLPSDVALQARAFAASDSSGFTEIRVPANELRHMTFFVGGASLVTLMPADTVTGGVETVWRGRARLTGTVTDGSGKPVVNAHATVWGTKLDAATNERGVFTLDGLPGGTHTLDVRVIGFIPVTTTVHLAESRPAIANVVVDKAQVLQTVTVRGEMVYARNLVEFNRRRRIGFGQFRTPEEIARRGPNVPLSRLLQDVMGIQVIQVGGGPALVAMRRNATHRGIASCTPSLYVDGRLDRVADFNFYYSDEIAGIEVYREHDRPFEFTDFSNACGSVAIWTRAVPPKPKKD